MAASKVAGGLTEDEAREEVASLVGGEAIPRIERLIKLLSKESEVQNLVARSSLSKVWDRHILDSAQLVSFARPTDLRWADIGTGAGFPGLVVGILDRFAVTLIEPRRRRAEFLNACISDLSLRNVTVIGAAVQDVAASPLDIVSARAVASTADLLAMSAHLAKSSTRFIFPKGQSAAADVESAQRDWHGVFHVEQSRTNPESGIIVIDQVCAK